MILILSATNPKGFEDTVCDSLMKRARFRPALDVAGEPMRYYFIDRVIFQMAR